MYKQQGQERLRLVVHAELMTGFEACGYVVRSFPVKGHMMCVCRIKEGHVVANISVCITVSKLLPSRLKT